MPQRPTPPLIRGYLWANRHLSKNKPISGPDWVAGTRRFATQVIGNGVAFLVLCCLLPADGGRIVMMVLGLIVITGGVWNLLNAQRIFDAANTDASQPM